MVVSPSGDSFLVDINSKKVFTCEVVQASNQDAYLKWFDNYGEEILETTGFIYVERVDDVTLKLYFTSIQEDHGGEYRCEGVVEGNPTEKSFTLQIFKDITFDFAPTPQNPVEFEDSMIHCQVSGNPAPEVSWRYRGQSISTGGRYVVDPIYGLTIKNITQEDNGQYECRAEVRETGSFDSVRIDVIVHVAPWITRELGTTIGVEHQQVAMECKADGLPAPYYEFYRINEGGELSRLSSTDTR